MRKPAAIILAAGLGKRMKSKMVKVLHPIAGRPMITYAVERVLGLGIKKVVVVLGHQADRIEGALAPFGLEIVYQPHQRGTADAVMQTKTSFGSSLGPVMILYGDTPLITEETLQRLISVHAEKRAILTLLTAVVAKPDGYGRIVRLKSGKILRVTEQKDASVLVRALREINTGFYVVEMDFLFGALDHIKNDNRQGEYYLTDMVEWAVSQKKKVVSVKLEDNPEEILGINTRMDLAVAEKVMRRRILNGHLQGGVTLMDPETTWIDAGVLIGRDTVIYPNTRIDGTTAIGEDCVIGSYCHLSDCQVGSHVTIKDSCVLAGSCLEDESVIGPFSHLRPGTTIRRRARIGNFVEAKKVDLGEGSKANHLTYLGDAFIGKNVNVGAGTITCNYDGFEKFETVIEDEVFIGSDTQLIAPVKVGRGAVIGAGSTITNDVPPESLAISRSEQFNKSGWVKKRKGTKKKRR